MRLSRRLLRYASAILLAVIIVSLGGGQAFGQRGIPPLGPLPPVPVPPDNPVTPEKVELGQLLFFDPRLGGDLSTPCSRCHDPAQGWGTDSPLSPGYPGTQHWRNAQTILNSAHYAKLFWEGSSLSLERQAPAAAQGNLAGNGDPIMMEERLAQVPEYVSRFKQVFGIDRPGIMQAWMAIAAFERTLVSDPAKVPFDRYANGDRNALPLAAKRGLALFMGKAGCIQCHNGPLASDQDYHNLGLPEHPLFRTMPLAQVAHRYEQYIKGVPEARYRAADRDLGLYYVTKRPEDIGKFRTPSLRELKYTAPYMHNGLFSTLDEVIDFYNAAAGPAPGKSPLLKPLGLTAQEERDLRAFLESLSSDEPPHIMDPPELPPYAVMK
ncbi:MAG: cytochrome-c peroxidase [Candidatus Methylomirabilales bacterium]